MRRQSNHKTEELERAVIGHYNKYPCLTMQSIGDKLGISRQRVHQILDQYSVDRVQVGTCRKCGKQNVAVARSGQFRTSKTKSLYVGWCNECLSNEKYVVVTCAQCGKQFVKSVKRVLTSGHDACSNECRLKLSGALLGGMASKTKGTHSSDTLALRAKMLQYYHEHPVATLKEIASFAGVSVGLVHQTLKREGLRGNKMGVCRECGKERLLQYPGSPIVYKSGKREEYAWLCEECIMTKKQSIKSLLEGR